MRLSDIFDEQLTIFDRYVHIANMDVDKIYKWSTNYIIVRCSGDDETPVALYNVVNSQVPGRIILTNAYVIPDARKGRYTENFIWFLKTRHGATQIQLGPQHSDDTTRLLKSLVQRFNMHWEKGDTGKFENTTRRFQQNYTPPTTRLSGI